MKSLILAGLALLTVASAGQASAGDTTAAMPPAATVSTAPSVGQALLEQVEGLIGT